LDEYLSGGISLIKHKQLDLLAAQPGHVVLDVGSGRGEASARLLESGAHPIALDYSRDAVSLTQQAVDGRAVVLQGDATALPFRPACFDRILMSDVIEHLPWAAAVGAMTEVRRVLAPGGRAVIHTSPNTWFLAIVMRPLRLLLRLLGRREVLARFADYDQLRGQMHPNELNPRSLRRLMRQAGVEATTWVDRDVLRSGASAWTAGLSSSAFVRLIGRWAGVWPLRLVFGNDLYVLVHGTDTV
jgi:ubiquinone/menaquinone biosynthesis C-methylase UbiE